MFLGKTLNSDELLIGTKYGTHTCRTVKRLVEEMRNPKDMINEVVGVPWDTKTSIGRPRRSIVEMLTTPKAATAGTVPGGPKVEMVRGRATSRTKESHKRGTGGEDKAPEKRARPWTSSLGIEGRSQGE